MPERVRPLRRRATRPVAGAGGIVEDSSTVPEPSWIPARSTDARTPLRRLTVGSAADPEEVRAERVAQAVLATLDAGEPPSGLHDGQMGRTQPAVSPLHRQMERAQPAVSPLRDGQMERAQPAVSPLHRQMAATAAEHAAVGYAGGNLDPVISGQIDARLGLGSPIPAALRRSMEGAFGRDLGQVRLHTDEHAAQLSRHVSARAFTVGGDVFFGSGQYRPDTADGQHTIAHELAHALQASGRVHRAFGIGEKKTDQEKTDDDQRKEAKRRNKQAVKASKNAVAVEKDRLKTERAKGVESRAASAAAITGGGRGVTAHRKDLDGRFEDHLDREAALYAQLVAGGTLADKAAEDAYQQVWMETKDDEVRAVRPARETEAERLLSQVKTYRGAAGVRGQMDEVGTRGTLLPKAMEELYEKFVVEFDGAVKQHKSQAEAERAATAAVWTAKNLQGLPERPEAGSALDLQAREDARRRVSVLGVPEKKENRAPEKKEKGLDTLSSIGEKVQSGFETVAPALNLVGAVASAAGLNKSVDMRNADSAKAGIAGNSYEEYKSGNTSEGNQATELFADFGGADIQQIMQTHQQVELGVKRVDLGAVSNSTSTLVGQGFSSVTAMLGGVISGANGAILFVKAVQKAHSTGDPHDIAAATRVGADALASFNASAKSASSFATVINPDITAAVAHVVPGLDIAAAALGILSGTMSMVDTGMRVQETQVALNSAHLAAGSKPNVLIYPLLRVEQSYVKKMEQNTWSTVKAVSDLAASIAQLASAGGYGIPAAYKAATNLLTLLHTIGHMIADDVLTMMAKKAQQDSIAVLEGSAEQRMQRDPAMAADGIIVSAIKGDTIAETFLGNFSVGTERVNAAMLGKLKPNAAAPGDETLFLKIRAALLDSMGNDVDPTYTYEKFAQSVGGVLGTVKKHTTGKFAKTGELAEGRNARGGSGGDRGVAWRMKMMLTREHKLDRKLKGLAAEQRFGPAGPLADGMACRCGKDQLPIGASSAQLKWFGSVVEAASDEVLQKAIADPANPKRWQDFFLDELTERKLRAVAIKVKGAVAVD